MNNSDPVEIDSPPTAARWRVRRHHAALGLLAVTAGLMMLVRWLNSESAAALAIPQPVVPAPPLTIAVEEPKPPPRDLLLGSWRDQYYGERTMTFLADGTGTMVIKLDSVGQAIYGPQLLFNLSWGKHDGVLEMKFTGGEPNDAVATISKLWGDTHLQRIESLNEAELQLRSTDSQNLYTLKRLPESAP